MKITQAAIEQVRTIINEQKPQGRLRLAVVGGGCAGFSYEFALEDAPQDDDITLEEGIIVDPVSLQYLTEATLDYVSTLQGSSFTIHNPSVKTTCGCGSSFSVD
jgi:iron-sulfur cluster assembly accessory protein